MPDAELVYAGRNVKLWQAPFATANALPANTIEWGEDWAGPWLECGYTQEGITIRLTLEREEITVDQILDPVLLPASARSVGLETNLAEWTAENLARGYGQGEVTTTAPGAGTKGYTDYNLGAAVVEDFNSWGMDFQKPYDGQAIRAIGWRGLASGDVEATFGQVDDNVKIPVEIRFLPDDSVDPSRLFIVRDLIPATGP